MSKEFIENIVPQEISCEFSCDPLGIQTTRPRLSWLLKSDVKGQIQTAYQVFVASSMEKLNENIADKWDSGKAVSDKSVNVIYQGKELSSTEKCFWKVRCWDKDGKESDYSKTATFEIGLLSESDWQGDWIGTDMGVSCPFLRKEFQADKKIAKARAYISGIGWYELYINGQKVSDHVLDPATSDYDKQVLYVTHDISDILNKGPNVIGVILGNGWYCAPSALRYGDSPRLRLQMNIEFVDGTTANVISDRDWKFSDGPIRHNDLWGGETYDARLENDGWDCPGYDDSKWNNAVLKDKPGGKMISQVMPPIKVNRTIEPVEMKNPAPGIYVFDMGQLFGGWARLKVKGPKGTQVTIKYSSIIDKDTSLVDQDHYERHHWFDKLAPGPNETDTYILKGLADGEAYEPRFTYHPVRYVQVEGCSSELTKKDIQGCVVHSAVDLSGDFTCSNPLLNQIHKNATWTLTNELFGMPLDCLHREPWAWIDPAAVTGTLYSHKFMPLFLEKWLRDIQHAQYDNGMIPSIAPRYNVEPYDDPAWGLNYPILAWYLHQYYDSDRVLEKHYISMSKLINYFKSVAVSYIIQDGLLGEHMLPGSEPGKEEYVAKDPPPPLVWTGYFYRATSVFSKIANCLGKTDDARKYLELAENIKSAMNEKWFDKATENYATGSQTSNLFPLALGIVPEQNIPGVAMNVTKDIKEKYNGHLHTGNTGTTCMIDVLARLGHADVMYEVANKKTYPGWGYMLENGATTIWEVWSLDRFGVTERHGGADSMIMWATIEGFFYNALAGIKGADYYGNNGTAGFKEINIKPCIPGDLTNATASIKTIRGMVSSAWEKRDDALNLKVTIPVNSTAQVSLPTMGLDDIAVTESDAAVWKEGSFIKFSPGVTSANRTGDYITFNVGSGTYSFELAGQN